MTEPDDSCCCCKVAVVGLVALAAYLVFRFKSSRKRKSPIKEDYKEDVVYLYQFPRVKNIPNISPFCLKLETWLRMMDIPYENAECGWQVRSCEGTLPFVELNGKEYPDSSLAIRDLEKIFNKESVGKQLIGDERATARALEELAETSLMKVIVYLRFVEHFDETFNQLPESVFGVFRPVVKCLAKMLFVPKVVANVKAAGIAKHSREEMLYIATEDIRALSSYLGTKRFFFGSEPARVDAALFGVIAQIVYAPYEFELKNVILKECANLKGHCERMRQRFWPDWEECTTKFTLNTEFKKEQ